MTGKVVVNRAMSLDGFVAAPGDSMAWVFDYATPDQVPDVMAATGATLRGRRTFLSGDTGAGLDRVSLAPVSSTTSGAVTAMRFRAVGRCAG
jgi:RibD C-terminal domain